MDAPTKALPDPDAAMPPLRPHGPELMQGFRRERIKTARRRDRGRGRGRGAAAPAPARQPADPRELAQGRADPGRELHRRGGGPARLRRQLRSRSGGPIRPTPSAPWARTTSPSCRRSASSASPSPGTTAAPASPSAWRSTGPERVARMAALDIVPTHHVLTNVSLGWGARSLPLVLHGAEGAVPREAAVGRPRLLHALQAQQERRRARHLHARGDGGIHPLRDAGADPRRVRGLPRDGHATISRWTRPITASGGSSAPCWFCGARTAMSAGTSSRSRPGPNGRRTCAAGPSRPAITPPSTAPISSTRRCGRSSAGREPRAVPDEASVRPPVMTRVAVQLFRRDAADDGARHALGRAGAADVARARGRVGERRRRSPGSMEAAAATACGTLRSRPSQSSSMRVDSIMA